MGANRNPWERRPEEPSLWYDRFWRYYLPMGADCSVLGAYRDYQAAHGKYPERPYRRAPRRWYINAKAWEWDQRVEAWLAQERLEKEKERAKDKEREEQERADWRVKRRELLEALYRKTLSMTKTVKSQLGLVRCSSAVKVVVEQLRLELGDNPEQRLRVTGALTGLFPDFTEALNRVYGGQASDLEDLAQGWPEDPEAQETWPIEP